MTKWKIKIKGIPGYHPLLDIVAPDGMHGVNHYVTKEHGTVSQKDVEDIDFGVVLKPKLKKSKQVASIAVMNNNRLLMGQRNDNQRWTLPGGHLNEGETPLAGAVRELYEETGIQVSPNDLQHLGSKQVTSFTGKEMIIHSYALSGKYDTNSSQDPDQEVKQWKWVDTTNGVPNPIMNKLHSPKNVTLKLLGLQKSFERVMRKSSKTNTVSQVQHSDPNWGDWNTKVWHNIDLDNPKLPSNPESTSKHLFVGKVGSPAPQAIVKEPMGPKHLKMKEGDEDGPNTSFFLDPKFRSSHREAAFNYMANQYGFAKYSPPASVFRHPDLNEPWSAMHFVPNALPISQSPINRPTDDHFKLAIFDTLLGNNDRHVNNVMTDSANNLKLIDNAGSFDYGHRFEHHLPAYAEAFQGEEVPHSVHKWIESLDDKQFSQHLQRVGAPRPIALAALSRLAEAKKWSKMTKHSTTAAKNLCDVLQVMQTHRLNDQDVMTDIRGHLYRNILAGRTNPIAKSDSGAKTV